MDVVSVLLFVHFVSDFVSVSSSICASFLSCGCASACHTRDPVHYLAAHLTIHDRNVISIKYTQ